MTNHPGHLQDKPLIEECAEAICDWTDDRSGFYQNMKGSAADTQYQFAGEFVHAIDGYRRQAFGVLSVLRKRGLLNLQGIEIVKRETGE